VERRLHLKFNFKIWLVDGVELVTMDPEKECPYFKGGTCLLYGTEEMPLDCRIYPAVPTPDGGVTIDYEGCPMAEHFDREDYKRKVLELLKPHMPLDRGWLKAYWRICDVETNHPPQTPQGKA